jgi:tRNA threonylcarbamoyladenosine biosynthesis protein TsaB
MTAAQDHPPQCALALETSSHHAAVALGDLNGLWVVRTIASARRHAATLVPTLRDLFREREASPHDLAWVFLSIGPGSFTGLRIGVTIARMLARTCGAKLAGIPTHDVIARGVAARGGAPEDLIVLTEAGRGNVYVSRHQLDRAAYRCVSPPWEAPPEAALAEAAPGTVATGDAVRRLDDEIAGAGLRALSVETWSPHVEALYALGVERARSGRSDNPSTLIPLYVRKAAAEELWERKGASLEANGPDPQA